MPTPELFFQFGMVHEQPPGRIALKDLDHIGRAELRSAVDHHMDMVRHDLHGNDRKVILIRYLLKMLDVADGKCLEDAVMLQLTIKELYKALDNLTSDDRAIIDEFADGKSDHEIADDLGRPQTTVSYRRKVILKQLRRDLDNWR